MVEVGLLNEPNSSRSYKLLEKNISQAESILIICLEIQTKFKYICVWLDKLVTKGPIHII